MKGAGWGVCCGRALGVGVGVVGGVRGLGVRVGADRDGLGGVCEGGVRGSGVGVGRYLGELNMCGYGDWRRGSVGAATLGDATCV